MNEFETDFSQYFDTPLKPVKMVSDLGCEEFHRRFRKPGIPVIITDLAAKWPAVHRWQRPDYLTKLAGDQTVFARDLDLGEVNFEKYKEVFVETKFGAFVDAITGKNPKSLYLTQGLIFRSMGILRALERYSYPAYLPMLEQDIELPRYWSRKQLSEGNLWMGSGNQVSGLHFDEMDNLNGMVAGSKRWLLFPRNETNKLLSGSGTGEDTVTRGFHAGEQHRFDAPERRALIGYQCVVNPGEMLYVPAGVWHQVFSGPGFSCAINFWYICLQLDWWRFARLRSRRMVGFKSRKGSVTYLVRAYAELLSSFYEEIRRPYMEPPEVGPVDYG